MKLISITKERKSVEILYRLLAERTQQESISHRGMPTYDEHSQFVSSHPYHYWALIEVDGVYVGATYLTRNREMGVGIFKQYRGNGHATEALKLVMEKFPGRFLANINPHNEKSINLFGKLGFKRIQSTYELLKPTWQEVLEKP